MSKYIDLDKLITYLNKIMESYKSKMVDPTKYPIDHIDLMAFLAREYQALILKITSLQQEKPKVDLATELKHYIDTTPKEQLEKDWRELESYGNIGPTVREFLYGKHTEVDLEKEYEEYVVSDPVYSKLVNDIVGRSIARHFYKLGLSARKEE